MLPSNSPIHNNDRVTILLLYNVKILAIASAKLVAHIIGLDYFFPV
jgi:hypothetical protein